VRITADTNVLLRIITNDDPSQSARAEELLESAEEVAIPLPVLCELAWVLRSTYRYDRARISASLRAVLGGRNVRAMRWTAEFGLDALDDGGDFADAIMAYDGAWLGGDVFASFDEDAVTRLTRMGHPARVP